MLLYILIQDTGEQLEQETFIPATLKQADISKVFGCQKFNLASLHPLIAFSCVNMG